MNKNNIKRLEKKLIVAQERLEVWLRQIIKAPVTVDHVCEVTEEICIALEELGVSLEEIYQQQEQLAVANRKVEEERQRYLELFDYAPDGYIITNKWGVIQEANQTAADMFHRRQDFIIGKPLWVFISQSHRSDLYKLLKSLEKGELIHSVELSIQPSYDASTFTAAISIAPIKNPQSELIGLRWLLRDVSQLKKAQAENARQQKRSQLLAEVTLKIHQSWQLESILQTAVTESQKLLQIERVLIFYLESDNSGKVLAEASSTQDLLYLQEQNFTCTFLPEQSKKQDILGVCQTLPGYCFEPTLNQTELSEISPQSEFTNLILPIFVHQKLWGFLLFQRHEVAYRWEDFEIDIGEQLANQIGIAVAQTEFILKMENLVVLRTKELRESNLKLQQEIEQRLQIEKSLRHSKEQLYLIADSLPVLIAYVDHNQCYQFNNRAYEDWFGQSLKEISGSPIRQVLGEKVYQQIKDKVEAVLTGQEVTFEMQIPYQNTSLRWVKVTYIPHKGENSKVIGFFVLTEDINDHKEMEQIKDEFISVVSHELRTPLTAIHGSLKLLNAGKGGTLNEKSQLLIGLAEKNTDRLVRLVNDILDLERIDSGKRTLEKKSCDAADLIATAVETMKQLAQEDKILLESDLISIPLIADPDSILQTLTNLISNAIKFSPAHSTILIQAEEHPNEVLFKVKDQGRGIPANKLENIFERFQQVDVSDSRNKQGTGLGLAICRQIIELHQGKIWAKSTPGKGSTFYFTLPNIKPDTIN